MAVIMQAIYDMRRRNASTITHTGADGLRFLPYRRAMMNGPEILRALKDRGVNQVEIGKVIDLPSSRMSELYSGKRQLSLNEAVKLIDKFDLEEKPPTPEPTPEINLNERVSRLLVLHVAKELGAQIAPGDSLVEELALDLQAFVRFAQSRSVRVTPATTQSFLMGRIPARRLPRTGTQ